MYECMYEPQSSNTQQSMQAVDASEQKWILTQAVREMLDVEAV